MLFNEIIFGPIKSRRLGNSLGINLLPTDAKLCNFECLYCECGWKHEKNGDIKSDEDHKHDHRVFHAKEEIHTALKTSLELLREKGEKIDSITFAGNGEPTMHPDFEGVMDDVISLRNLYCVNAEVSVLSNSLLASRPTVRRALMKADRRIMKLDAGNETMFNLLNQPNGQGQFAKVMETLCSFDGDLEIQSFFVRGMHDGTVVDNTTPEEVASWLECIRKIHPKKVLIYSLDRPAPATGLTKVGTADLESIALPMKSIGIETAVF